MPRLDVLRRLAASSFRVGARDVDPGLPHRSQRSRPFAITQPLQHLMALFTSEALLILFSLLICAAASSDFRSAKSLTFRSRFIVILGEWSFAFYLIHATLIYLTLEIVGHRVSGLTGLLVLAVLLVGSIAAAGALHVWVERPVERMLRAWQNRKVIARKAVRNDLSA